MDLCDARCVCSSIGTRTSYIVPSLCTGCINYYFWATKNNFISTKKWTEAVFFGAVASFGMNCLFFRQNPYYCFFSFDWRIELRRNKNEKLCCSQFCQANVGLGNWKTRKYIIFRLCRNQNVLHINTVKKTEKKTDHFLHFDNRRSASFHNLHIFAWWSCRQRLLGLKFMTVCGCDCEHLPAPIKGPSVEPCVHLAKAFRVCYILDCTLCQKLKPWRKSSYSSQWWPSFTR